MCLSAHNWPTFGLGGHIITRVLDQSTLKNLQCESAHVLLAHNYVRPGLILRDLVYTCLKSAKNLYLSHRFFCKIRQIVQTWRENQACSRLAPARAARLARNPSTSSAFVQETRYPHAIDTGLKSLATCVLNLRTHPARPSASS